MPDSQVHPSGGPSALAWATRWGSDMSRSLNLATCRSERARMHALAGAVVAAVLIAVSPAAAQTAASAPAATELDVCKTDLAPSIPPAEEPATNNIDKLKKRLLAYQSSKYEEDIAKVIESVEKFVKRRVAENRRLPVDQMKRFAIVLDIDDASLSNWENIKANNFGFIESGPCFLETDRKSTRLNS